MFSHVYITLVLSSSSHVQRGTFSQPIMSSHQTVTVVPSCPKGYVRVQEWFEPRVLWTSTQTLSRRGVVSVYTSTDSLSPWQVAWSAQLPVDGGGGSTHTPPLPIVVPDTITASITYVTPSPPPPPLKRWWTLKKYPVSRHSPPCNFC